MTPGTPRRGSTWNGHRPFGVRCRPTAPWRRWPSLRLRLCGTRLAHAASVGLDVVHVHEPFAPRPSLRAAGRTQRFPAGGHLPQERGQRLLTVLRPVARGWPAASPSGRRCRKRRGPTASDALGGAYEVGFNGVEVDRYRGVQPWPAGRPTVLFLGRHEERKGSAGPPRGLRGTAQCAIRRRTGRGGAGPVCRVR